MQRIYNIDNMEYQLTDDFEFIKPDVIYMDCIYEDNDFWPWISKYWKLLRDDGIFIIQTDWHTASEIDVCIKWCLSSVFVNHLVWKNEWGNYPKNKFHQCYDDILIYSNSKNWKFNPDVIQVQKATANTKLNPSNRQTKPATAWIDDVCLTTTARERVKKDDGHCVRWQKPLKLYDAIIAPFVNEYSFVLDPFMGTGSLGKWCKKNNLNYVGIEKDREVFELANKNMWSKL